MIVRGYQPKDQEAVARITKAAWSGVSMAELREQRFGVLGGESWADQKATAIITKCTGRPEQVLVAEIDGAVVGYATFALSVGGEVGVVGDNAVDPAWQGRGIGTALVAQVQKRLVEQGVRMLEVQTFEHDKPARRVYERLGFEELAKTVHYIMPASKVSKEGLIG